MFPTMKETSPYRDVTFSRCMVPVLSYHIHLGIKRRFVSSVTSCHAFPPADDISLLQLGAKQTNKHEDFPGVGLRHNLSSSCSVPSVWAFPSLSEQFVRLLLIVEHIKVDMTGHVKTSCCLYTLSPSAGLDEAPQTPLMNLCIHLKNNNHGPSLTRFLSLYMITPLGLPVCYCLGSLGNWWTLPVPQALTVDMYGGP